MNQITAVPIKRVSLHDEIVARVRDKILEGTLRPGHRVAELALCRELGISRTPLREALKVLASENLITLLLNRGAMVTEIVVEEISELFEVMEPLERLIGQLAVERASNEAVASLQAMHDAMAEHFRQGQRHAYFDANQAIHRRFAEIAGNQTLLGAYVAFAGKIRRARYIANLSVARWSESLQEHEAFMIALERREADRLGQLLQEHSRRTGLVVCEALRRDGARQGSVVAKPSTSAIA